ncbi:MAG: SGNH/GDSL hydrolase family protein [Candidatus Saccharimonadales bacterium]
MIKKVVLGVAVVVLVLAAVEVIALLRLKANLSSYAAYWKQVPTSGTFTYVALGDSAAQGIGASKPQLGYVGLLADRIEKETGKTVRIVNLSVSGAKIQDVIDKQLPRLQNYKPDLVTIDIGANNVAGRYDARVFQKEYDQLAAALPKGTIVGNMPYFGGRIRHNAQALDANKLITAATKKYDLKVADLQSVTKSHNSLNVYAADYFHPSNRGYQNWVDAYWQVIQPTLN